MMMMMMMKYKVGKEGELGPNDYRDDDELGGCAGGDGDGDQFDGDDVAEDKVSHLHMVGGEGGIWTKKCCHPLAQGVAYCKLIIVIFNVIMLCSLRSSRSS